MLSKNWWLFFLVLAIALASTFQLLQGSSPGVDGDDGLWVGRFDINGKGNYEFLGLFINNRVVGHSKDAKVIYRGDVSLKNGRYHSNMQMFFMAGSPLDAVTLEGTLPGPGRIEARYRTHGAGDRGSLKLNRDATSDKKASLAAVADSWVLYRGFSILKLDIDAAGAISGGNDEGCSYDGTVKPARPGYNAYDVTIAVTSCDNLNGTWSGMAYLSDGIAPGDTLNLHLFEKDYAMLLPVARNKGTRLIDERRKWNP